jgi:hypothetical protein
MMDPYRGRELKTKGLHWKRMKGLEAVRISLTVQLCFWGFRIGGGTL